MDGKSEKTKLYTVKAFSEATNITVRTLHHYDHIGLLKPSARSHSGYRLYTGKDKQKLCKIGLLKFLDFPLKTIHALLPKKSHSLVQVFDQQQGSLEQQYRQAGMMCRTNKFCHEQSLQSKDIEWEMLNRLRFLAEKPVFTTQMWRTELLNQEECEQFDAHNAQLGEQGQKYYDQKWQQLFSCIRNQHQYTPEYLMGVWRSLLDEGGLKNEFSALGEKIWLSMRTIGMPVDWMPYFDHGVIDFARDMMYHNSAKQAVAGAA